MPEGFSGSHRFETDLVFLIGRSQLLGPGDAPALAGIMKQYRLEPYAVFTGYPAPDPPAYDWPHWDDETSRDERFVRYLNSLLPLCQPPHPDEVEMFARFARVGIGPGLPADVEALPDNIRSALAGGVAEARDELSKASSQLGTTINGWMSMDAFGNREAYAGDYLRRAAESMVGWGGNDRIEASYPMARVDADGNPFDGSRKYQLRLETEPPVRAFWSVTMCDQGLRRHCRIPRREPHRPLSHQCAHRGARARRRGRARHRPCSAQGAHRPGRASQLAADP